MDKVDEEAPEEPATKKSKTNSGKAMKTADGKSVRFAHS